MDTNSLAIILQALAAKSVAVAAPPQPASEKLMIATMIIAALGPIIAAVVTFINSRSNAETKRIAVDTAATVEKVHVAVNSGQTAMIARFEAERAAAAAQIDALRGEILALSKDLSAAEGLQRGTEIAKTTSPAVTASLPQAPASLVADAIKMAQPILVKTTPE